MMNMFQCPVAEVLCQFVGHNWEPQSQGYLSIPTKGAVFQHYYDNKYKPSDAKLWRPV